MDDANGIPIFYINLASRPDRRERMEALLSGLAITASRIEAITPETLPSEMVAACARAPERRRLWPVELACLASHRVALQAIVDTGARVGVVLEDDVRISRDFKRVVRAVAGRGDFDVVRIETFADRYRMRTPAIPLTDGYALYGVAQFDGGAGGYMITAGAARRCLDQEIDATCPADDWFFNMQRAKPRGWRALQLVPAIVIQYWHRTPEGHLPEDSDIVRARLERGAKYGAKPYRKSSFALLEELRRIARKVTRATQRAMVGTPVFYRCVKVDVKFADDLPDDLANARNGAGRN